MIQNSRWTRSHSSPTFGYMNTKPYQLYIERIDPSKNMARYYVVSLSETLFNEICVVRRWGRIGSWGQEKRHYFTQELDALEFLLGLLNRKRKRGYSIPTSLPEPRSNAIVF
jgi:predicted DNA-binding WGR domain protein